MDILLFGKYGFLSLKKGTMALTSIRVSGQDRARADPLSVMIKHRGHTPLWQLSTITGVTNLF